MSLADLLHPASIIQDYLFNHQGIIEVSHVRVIESHVAVLSETHKTNVQGS
jgi:hypothetical protein